MIVTGIILLVIGVLAKIGIVWTTGFVVLILGLIALLIRMTGHGIGGQQARRRREAPARRRGFPAGRPWRTSSPRRRGTPSATARSWRGPPRRGSGRHRSCTRRSAPAGQHQADRVGAHRVGRAFDGGQAGQAALGRPDHLVGVAPGPIASGQVHANLGDVQATGDDFDQVLHGLIPAPRFPALRPRLPAGWCRVGQVPGMAGRERPAPGAGVLSGLLAAAPAGVLVVPRPESGRFSARLNKVSIPSSMTASSRATRGSTSTTACASRGSLR
jgi:hypothetical protein